MKRKQMMAVGLESDAAVAAAGLAEDAGLRFTAHRNPHDALRQLAQVPLVDWTIVVPVDVRGIDIVVFVSTARDLAGPDATVVVVGVDPVSTSAMDLEYAGASTCVLDAQRLHHPSVALGPAA